VVECIEETKRQTGEPGGDCAVPTAPPTPRLTAVPALQGIQRLNAVIVSGTAFVDMQSIGSLKCPPFVLLILSNPRLQSLDGLQNISPWTANTDGPALTIVENPGLTTPLSVSQLSQYLRCGEGGSDLAGLGTVTVFLPACSPAAVCPPSPLLESACLLVMFMVFTVVFWGGFRHCTLCICRVQTHVRPSNVYRCRCHVLYMCAEVGA
jgi:hypothetical protein